MTDTVRRPGAVATTTADGLPPMELSPGSGYPMIHAPVFHTPSGTPYLRHPGVVVTSVPRTDIGGLRSFLDGFDEDLGFGHYLDDPVELSDLAQLVKTAGQACYASFSPKRTFNENAETYLHNILASGHGSVIEHANVSLFVYGISRSLSHELVRHRIMSTSQLSQRYVSGRVLRFVERPEYAEDPELHAEFEADIDHSARRYEETAAKLYQRQAAGLGILSGDARTDLRKKVQQAARSKLPNETETFGMFTGNMRAWRHIVSMRASEHAETEIRALAVSVFRCLQALEPLLVMDARLRSHTDGTLVVEMDHPKV